MKNRETVQKNEMIAPDYRKIYTDIIDMKHPEKKNLCERILGQDRLSALDVIQLNKIIFGKSRQKRKHRSYDESSIIKTLNHQKEHCMTNVELSRSMGISRNTIAKWKKIFLKEI